MKIVLKTLDAKKIAIISSISVVLLSAIITAFQNYYKKRKKQQEEIRLKSRSNSTLSRRNLNQQINNKPSEELLSLGLNYLDQAIKCWETALDSIESAAYMQSQLLALPNNEHAELVFKLRTLLERADNINVDCTHKLLNSSKTLQIIQSRLELRQQQYATAILQQNSKDQLKASDNEILYKQTSKLSYLSDEDDNNNNNNNNNNSPIDDDQESFVSATSDMLWIEQTIEMTNFNLYRVGLEMAQKNSITCRVLRTKLLCCENDNDFLGKLYAIRLGFDKLLSDTTKKGWFISEGKSMVTNLLVSAERDPSLFQKAFDNMINFAQITSSELIQDELATRGVLHLTFYDIVLDFILLDAFDDLENPPSAILAAINNRWISQGFKETALSTTIWTVLKAKRRLLKYPNGFISHFYSINEHLVPTLALGFFGNNKNLNDLCLFLKEQIVEYLKCLFDLKRTNYSNIDCLLNDIESHTIKYLDLLSNKFNK